MELHLYASILIWLMFLGIIVYQARGRHESIFLWIFIYLVLSCAVLIINNVKIVFLILLFLTFFIIKLMRTWKRQFLFVVNETNVKDKQIIEDLRNMEGVDDNVDIYIKNEFKRLKNPIQLKSYFDNNESLVLKKDIELLKIEKIKYDLHKLTFVTILVEECDFARAAQCLGIPCEDKFDPSLN